MAAPAGAGGLSFPIECAAAKRDVAGFGEQAEEGVRLRDGFELRKNFPHLRCEMRGTQILDVGRPSVFAFAALGRNFYGGVYGCFHLRYPH